MGHVHSIGGKGAELENKPILDGFARFGAAEAWTEYQYFDIMEARVTRAVEVKGDRFVLVILDVSAVVAETHVQLETGFSYVFGSAAFAYNGID